MIVDKLNIFIFSDIHLGANLASTESIITNLNIYLPNDSSMTAIDLIIIPGDFYDRLLSYIDPVTKMIELWIVRLLRICKKYDIVLRVLEGTPSHDWKQPLTFTHLNEVSGLGVDLLYWDKLGIEHSERFGIDILYLPDEWLPDPDDIWLDVKKMLGSHSIATVDLCIMHGAFQHQLPSHVPAPKHSVGRYESIVTAFCFVGHIHKHSVVGKIISPGSFDRIRHGEETPKGFLHAILRKTGNHECTFIENEGATKFVTLKCTSDDMDKTLTFLKKKIEKLPEHSHVRILAKPKHPILAGLETLMFNYPSIKFSTKKDDTVEALPKGIVELKKLYKPIHITRDNIVQILTERVNKKKDICPKVITRIPELLNDIT